MPPDQTTDPTAPRDPSGPKTAAEAARQRRDIVSGAVMPEERLLRFVAGPGGIVVPDLDRKLPGRGLWVEATREAVETAAKKGLFSRAAKTKLAAPADLADQVEAMMARRCLERLGLARRAGALTWGMDKASSSIAAGKVAWMIEASDGSADGRRKLLQIARRQPRPPRLCGAFTSEELGLASGLGHVIHLVFLAGRWAERWTEEIGRLAGFRPILPTSWGEEA
ncbi:MAG TPA: RNA-binding protein [Caulobacteraceae bacterium]|nr:RNA-binding protein [Caulobacteraceae bacterium]